MRTPRTDGDEQLGLGLRVPSRPLRLSRDLARVPLDRYRIPEKDGRKWKAIARQRMALAEWLAIHGDADGSRIFPSEHSITSHFGWSRRQTFYLLKNLKELLLLDSCGLTSQHGTRVRRMNLAAFLGAGVQDSAGAGVQDSRISPRAGVQDSRAGVQSNVAPNRHLTDTRPVAGVEVGSLKGGTGSDHRFSPICPKPTTVLSPQTIKGKKQTARAILIAEGGFDPHMVDVALLRVADLARALKKSPRSVAYFVASVKNSLADPDEAEQCRSIAAERRRSGVPIDAPLRPDEWHVRSKIALVQESVEVADRDGRDAREVQAEMLAAVAGSRR
jgi:hypothetical protein